MNHLDDLRQRLKNVILETCNKIGCRDCDLKWDDGCSATELQNKIWNEKENLRKSNNELSMGSNS